MYAPTITGFADVAADKAFALRRSPIGFFIGAMLAGTYIGIAMILALSTAAGLEPGVRPLVMGATFGLGLILTVFAGAELFTGYVMYLGFGIIRGTIGWGDVVKLAAVVWIGNLVGAWLLAALYVAGGGGQVFANAITMFDAYAAHKVDAGAVALIARAVLCNWLVCLGLWTAARLQSESAKCIVMAWSLLAFVAAGFEHSIANMTALTLGLLAPGSTVTVEGIVRNLGLVTFGNVLGTLIFIVGAYGIAAQTDDDRDRHPDQPDP